MIKVNFNFYIVHVYLFYYFWPDPAINFRVIQAELKIQGFIVSSFKKDWPTAFTELNEYIKQVQLSSKNDLSTVLGH
jgi:NADPH-dependent curcumin reductase CurA